MTVHESFRSNESESLNSQQLSSSFGPGYTTYNLARIKRAHFLNMEPFFVAMPARKMNGHFLCMTMVIYPCWLHGTIGP